MSYLSSSKASSTQPHMSFTTFTISNSNLRGSYKGHYHWIVVIHQIFNDLVLVDRLTKFAYFGPLWKGFIETNDATLFVHMVYKLHGLLKSILSDTQFFLVLSRRICFYLSDIKLSHIICKLTSKLPQTIHKSRQITCHGKNFFIIHRFTQLLTTLLFSQCMDVTL